MMTYGKEQVGKDLFCGDCKFFSPPPEKQIGEKSYLGECRRKPPVATASLNAIELIAEIMLRMIKKSDAFDEICSIRDPGEFRENDDDPEPPPKERTMEEVIGAIVHYGDDTQVKWPRVCDIGDWCAEFEVLIVEDDLPT